MAFCSNCGTKMDDGAKFCPSCGTPAGGAAPAPKPATEKVGNIRKCPACGAEVPAMAAVCPSCGHEFNNVQVTNSIQAFFEKIDAIDQEVYEQQTAKEASQSQPTNSIFGALGASMSASLQGASGSSGGKRKVALIEGYPIPNSKEDILEFTVLAASRLKGAKSGYFGMRMGALPMMPDDQSLEQAWKAKCEQAYNKAKLSFGSDKDAIANIERILKEKKVIK